MVDALRDASPLTLTFATSCFSPAARQLAFTTLRHMQVKRRLLRPVPPGLELSEELLELIAINLLRTRTGTLPCPHSGNANGIGEGRWRRGAA